LADEVQHAPILDIDRHLVQQLQVVDGGIIRLHVGSEDEVIVRQMIADVSDSVFGTAMARSGPCRLWSALRRGLVRVVIGASSSLSVG
jgi:hypothetical protein